MVIIIDYIEVYYNGDLIGYIGQDVEGLRYFNAKNEDFKRILKAFVSAIKVESAVIEGNVSVSTSEIMLIDNPDWINYLEYNLPVEYTSSKLLQSTLKKFNGLKV